MSVSNALITFNVQRDSVINIVVNMFTKYYKNFKIS